MIVVPIVAASELMLLLTDALTAVYHLYTNAATIDADTTLTAFVEASWTGYAAIPVNKWYPPAVETIPAVDSADPLVWTLTTDITPATVYGYYVTQGAFGPLLWAEAAPKGGYVVADAGDCITLIPQLSLQAIPSPASLRRRPGRRRQSREER